MIKTLLPEEFNLISGGGGVCKNTYILSPKDNCKVPASSDAMLRVNNTDGVIKVVCSIHDSPWRDLEHESYASCFPNSAMQIFCLDTPSKNWCLGSIEVQWPSS